MKPLFGIDLGGSKIELVVLDPKTHLTLERTRIKTPAGDYLATISAIKNLTFKAIESWGEPKNLGIGIPGCICPNSGLVKNANSTCLIGEDLKKDLEIALKNKKIIIENDANCFALSESNNGAGKGFDSVFGVILGTGVGGGFVFKGNLLRGPNSISGEWGHNPMPWVSQTELEKRLCYCGKTGCIETFLSGPGLELSYKQTCKKVINAKEIVSLAQKGDKCSIVVLENYFNYLSMGLATLINTFDPNAIILGGGLSNIPEICKKVDQLLPNWVFGKKVNSKILTNLHGDSSGVFGAALLK